MVEAVLNAVSLTAKYFKLMHLLFFVILVFSKFIGISAGSKTIPLFSLPQHL